MMGCVRRYLEVVVPRRFCIFLTWQLKNWLRVQGVAPKLYCFWATGSPLQYQVPAAGLSNFLLDATGLSAALPSTRQSMHPSVALEKSTLRRMSLNSSCCRVSPELSAPPGLLGAIGLDAVEELVAKKKRFLLVATWTQPFLIFFDLVSSSPLWSSLSS